MAERRPGEPLELVGGGQVVQERPMYDKRDARHVNREISRYIKTCRATFEARVFAFMWF